MICSACMLQSVSVVLTLNRLLSASHVILEHSSPFALNFFTPSACISKSHPLNPNTSGRNSLQKLFQIGKCNNTKNMTMDCYIFVPPARDILGSRNVTFLFNTNSLYFASRDIVCSSDRGNRIRVKYKKASFVV